MIRPRIRSTSMVFSTHTYTCAVDNGYIQDKMALKSHMGLDIGECIPYFIVVSVFFQYFIIRSCHIVHNNSYALLQSG